MSMSHWSESRIRAWQDYEESRPGVKPPWWHEVYTAFRGGFLAGWRAHCELGSNEAASSDQLSELEEEEG